MGFQLSPLPANLNVTPPDILGNAQKAASLKNMQSETALRQQLAPLDVQEAQGRVAQQGQTQQLTDQQIQMQQLQLANQQKTQTALSDPNFRKDFDDWQKTKSDGTASTPDGSPMALHPVAEYLAERKGLPLTGPGGALQISDNLTGASQKQAELAKTQGEAGVAKLKMHSDQIGNFEQIALPILEETDPVKQAAGLQNLLQDIKTNPGFYPPEATQHIATMGTIPGLAAAANTAKILQMQNEDATKKATATKAQLEVQPVTPDRLKSFTQTVNSYSALSPQQRQAAIAESQGARTVDELSKIQDRVDLTNKAEQMHADSMAQTAAFKGQAFGQKGLEANDKTWTDPQHGYLQVLSQANEGKAAIKTGADGNGLLTSLAPTMAVLGMNSFAGTHRISPAEAQAAGAPGGWVERFNAWADKSTQGKLSPQLAKEGNTLFDQLIDAKYQASLQASSLHAKGYGIPEPNMPAMDREGNVSTLDKVKAATGGNKSFPAGGGAGGGKGGAIAVTDPKGGVHTFPDQASANKFKKLAGIQ